MKSRRRFPHVEFSSTRRNALTALLALGIAAPVGLRAQPSSTPRRIIVFTASTAARDWFLAGMRDRGWKDGVNIECSVRQVPEIDEAALRSELQDRTRRVDAIVAAGALRIRAAMNATRSIPIIGIDLESDPVARGFVKSLARPKGNVSGVWMDLPELSGKHLQLLNETMPQLERVGVLWDDRFTGPQLAHTEAAARASRTSLFTVAMHGPADLPSAFDRIVMQRSQALLVFSSPTVFVSLSRIAEAARDLRLPSVCLFSNYAEVGGLLSYGPNFALMYRQLAGYVDRVLLGSDVGDLPIERPTQFDLVINLKTAKALRLPVGPSMLSRANRVIE